jgi:hypothetical protein
VSPKRIYLAVAACAAIAYIGVLWNAFAWDDLQIISYNDLVHSWSGLWTAFVNPYWGAQRGQLYRPLAVASYVLDWHLDGTALFHAVNVAWHAGVSVLVAALLYRWSGAAAALVGGVLFAVHPVHVEAVANVVGRSELMAAAFTLLAVYAAIERESPAWSTLCWVLGLLSKENAVVAPALIVAAWAFALRRPTRDRVTVFLVAWVVAGAGYALLRHQVLHGYPTYVAVVFGGQPPGVQRLTAVAALTDITRLLFLPIELRVDYSPAERTAVTSVLDGRFFAGVLALAAWIFWFVLARRRGQRIEQMGIVWVALAFAPVANLLFPTGVLVAERTLYLPSAGLAVAVGALAGELRGRALAGVVAVVAIAGGVRNALRVPVWRDQESVMRSIVKDSPRSYFAFLQTASSLLIDGQNDKALQAALVAARLAPGDARPNIVAAHAALKTGQYAQAADLLGRLDSVCNICLSYYQIEAEVARRLGDDAVADSLLAHAQRVGQR